MTSATKIRPLGRRKNGHVETTALRLDLGCGENVRDGFLGVDKHEVPGVSVVHDLTDYPWPWEDSCVSEVFCSHFFEHLTGPERVDFMNELYRVLAKGGTATIITPYWSSMRAIQDPTHAWPPICEASYLYFNAEWRAANKLDHYLGIRCDFDYAYGHDVPNEWASKNVETLMYAIGHYLNVAADLHVTLTKR
jgi:Methyltransferase domain